MASGRGGPAAPGGSPQLFPQLQPSAYPRLCNLLKLRATVPNLHVSNQMVNFLPSLSVSRLVAGTDLSSDPILVAPGRRLSSWLSLRYTAPFIFSCGVFSELRLLQLNDNLRLRLNLCLKIFVFQVFQYRRCDHFLAAQGHFKNCSGHLFWRPWVQQLILTALSVDFWH